MDVMPLFPKSGDDSGNRGIRDPDFLGERRRRILPGFDEAKYFFDPFVDFQRVLVAHATSSKL